jgi:hypothetical protein
MAFTAFTGIHHAGDDITELIVLFDSEQKRKVNNIKKKLIMVFIGSRNRYNEFRDEFTKDTGIKNVDENIELYLIRNRTFC